ncbi:MAG: membrane dipeptidase [Gemmatimonadetes bacterium]|nr:membrane dipeptidase [Gemmatimonadota bacterium]
MIRLTVTLIALLTLPSCAPAQLHTAATDPHLERALRVLTATPLVDGHNDLPWAIRTSATAPMDVAAYDLRARTAGHTDIERLRAGRVGVQFWSVYVPSRAVAEGAARVQLEQMDIARQIFNRYPDVFEETLTADEALRSFREGRIASVMGMEGGHVLENSLGALRSYYDLGARYLTLTHSENTDWADAGTDTPRHDGLTAFGKEVVREMNRLGMLVDLSHVSPATMHDALDVSEAPVIFSHSSARGVTDHPRNVPDDVLRRMSQNGGVVMITFVPQFINAEIGRWQSQPEEYRRANPAPRATLADAVRHIEHVRDVAGIDHVGIGGDFDGISTVPVGLEDVASYPNLFAELSRRGWSEENMRKLAGENAMRSWREAERVAARLQTQRGPSTATIEQLDGAAPRGR